MGEVYRARDSRLGRTVAIKVLPAHLSANVKARERFVREAQAISSLNHPHICTLHDVGHHDGIDYLVMEHVEGDTLADVISRGPVPLRQVLRYGTEIADALDKAHRGGIVHRDLKPGNIMITRSGVKVLDFGLAKSAATVPPPPDAPTMQKSLTDEGAIVGTLQYMAPEQLDAAPVDARTDIFALGVILYEMATGRRAFDAKSRGGLIAAILEHDPEPITSTQPHLPAALDQIVRRCLSKSPEDRLQSARDLQFALEAIDEQSRSGERPRTAAEKRRVPLLLTVVLPVVLLAAATAAWMVTRDRARAGGLTAAKTFAVLPFANLGKDASHDYLRLAIPDEVTTILSYNPALVVRPFSTSRHVASDIDPREAGKKLNASGIVSGHIRSEGGGLGVTLEVIDVRDNRLFWRDAFEIPSADLLTMRRELARRIQNGLMPKLAAGGHSRERASPRNADAYALYLRAAAFSSDPRPNKEAYELLEQSVRLDPAFAPAWAAISKRAYYDYAYSDGGDRMFARAQEAGSRALALDPDLVEAATSLITIRTEGGHLAEAFRQATELVTRRPDSADAHFALSYVLRYGGALAESAAECEKAWSIDRGNRGLRSCSVTFTQLGKYERALDFTRLDEGSQWSNRQMAAILLRQGKAEEGLPLFTEPLKSMLSVPGAVDAGIRELKARSVGRFDGEPFYSIGSFISYTGRSDLALEWLRESVRRKYCGYPAVESDPLYAGVRTHPRYPEVRDLGRQCHETFLRETGIRRDS